MNILITGASRGIGKAIALQATKEGHSVALVSRNIEALQRVEDEVTSLGGIAKSFQCDVTSSKQVAELRTKVLEHFSGIDVVVNNAGVAPSAKLEDTTDDLWSDTFSTNVCSTFYITRTFLPELRASSNAHIINIASTAALEGFAYTAAYTASKHAVLGLSRALAKELFRANITVSTLCPGFVRTSILDESVKNITAKTGMTNSDAERQLGTMNKTGKIIEPIEVAEAVILAMTMTPDPNGYELIL
jgi:3-hydroxybutyrate dehydrogenase